MVGHKVVHEQEMQERWGTVVLNSEQQQNSIEFTVCVPLVQVGEGTAGTGTMVVFLKHEFI